MLTLSKIVVEVDDDVLSHIVITIKTAKSEINYRSLPPSSGVVLTRLFGPKSRTFTKRYWEEFASRRKRSEQLSSH